MWLSSDSSGALDIVYTVDSPFGALFAERDIARRTADTWRAVEESTTWGEFRTTMPAGEWKEVVELLDNDVPDDDTPFSSGAVPGWGDDGWYIGPWPPQDVLDWFPDDLIDKYEGDFLPNPNGENLFLRAEAGDQIAEELRARGHRVEKTPTGDLADWVAFL